MRQPAFAEGLILLKWTAADSHRGRLLLVPWPAGSGRIADHREVLRREPDHVVRRRGTKAIALNPAAVEYETPASMGVTLMHRRALIQLLAVFVMVGLALFYPTYDRWRSDSPGLYFYGIGIGLALGGVIGAMSVKAARKRIQGNVIPQSSKRTWSWSLFWFLFGFLFIVMLSWWAETFCRIGGFESFNRCHTALGGSADGFIISILFVHFVGIVLWERRHNRKLYIE